jgi:hypothetical protein
MLQKCVLYLRGFLRMSTLVIIFILLVTFYFYQDKIREVSGKMIDSSRQDGTIFYVGGIWDKMTGFATVSHNRNQQAIDLLGKTKKVDDDSRSYSLDIPESWRVVDHQGSFGQQVSKLIVESSAFSQHNEGTDIFFDNGAQLTVQIIRGEQERAKLPDGGHGKMLINKANTDLGGSAVDYYFIRDNSVKSGEVISAFSIHNGNTYDFKFVYNPKYFEGAEFAFQEILHSFRYSN